MIKKLSVKNFKSIKELEIDCKKINLFIGEPNAGKSNILEALGLLSWYGHRRGQELNEYVRFESMANLFYDNSVSEAIKIAMLKDSKPPESAGTVRTDRVEMEIMPRGEMFNFEISVNGVHTSGISLNSSGEFNEGLVSSEPEFRSIRFYRFKELERIQTEGQVQVMSFLMPPHGSNLYRVVSTSKKLRANVSAFFRDIDFKLMLRTATETLEFVKEIEDVLYNFPYISLSDTLQRMIFYTVAMESNENSTLVFEEPESHTFPYYTKYLGEKIALDESNQYFIATHNPYFLLSVLEKAPKDDVNVFVTYSPNYQTKVKCLSDEEVSELMTYEPFFNLDSFIEDEEEDEEDIEEELQ